MDERVLKWVTVFSVALTIVVGVTFLWLPQVEQTAVWAAEENEDVGYPVGVEPSQEVVSNRVEIAWQPFDEDEFESQIRIELPGGLSPEEIIVESDYLTQTLFIRIPGAILDYFSEYRVKGTCEHISELYYYPGETYGVIAIRLDRLYEPRASISGDYLYLDFVSPHEIYDKVIVIDAGHGGEAIGVAKEMICEKDINLAMLLELKALLDACPENIGVYYTRTTDVNPSLDQRVDLANKADADLFLSIHNNSTATIQFNKKHGSLVLFNSADTSEYSSRRFAQLCLTALTETLDSKDMGLMEGNHIRIVRRSNVPVALVEVGFVTNREELKKLNSKEYQEKTAQALYDAIMRAFEEGF